jgi:ABC-type transporter MlaC component
MKQITLVFFLLAASACDSENKTVTQGREAVKEVVTQPFNTLDAAKDSLRQSEDKQKAALEQADKENK